MMKSAIANDTAQLPLEGPREILRYFLAVRQFEYAKVIPTKRVNVMYLEHC
jgi:hypothetical protein